MKTKYYIKTIPMSLIMICTFIMCGCGTESTKENESDNTTVEIIEDRISEESPEEDGKSVEGHEADQKTIAVNTTEETIVLDSQGVHFAKACGTDDKNIYLCQWEREGRTAALFQLGMGSDSIQKMNIEIPDKMDVHGIFPNIEGHIYLFLQSSVTTENVTSIIREYDEECNLVGELDISNAIGGKMAVIQTFLVDSEENFYIKGMAEAICISRSGECLWESKDATQGIGDSYAATIGKDGNVYITYKRDNISYMGRINPHDGTIAEEYPLNGLRENEQILAIRKGTDSDFLIYSGISGIWIWNVSDESVESRKVMSESEVSAGEYILIRTFLEDGRFLLIENISEGDVITKHLFRYIPAGK